MNNSAKGKSVLNLIKMQGFQEFSIDELANIRTLLEKQMRLKAEQHVH